MKPPRCTSTFCLMILSCMTAILPARTWTDVNGRKLEGKLVASDDREIVVRLENGKNVTIQRIRLSKEDLDFLDNEAEESGDEEDAKLAEEKPAAPLENFDAPWPENIRFTENPEIRIVTEDAENKEFVYESTNYRFICDVRLSKQVVNGFSVMFEATHDYCRALPLALSGGVKNDGKYHILLFETKASYIKAGGPPESAGVFIPGRNVVMVPLSSLGVRPVGSGYMLDRDQSSGTLIHEITHQLTPRPYYSEGSMGWFSEGIAEYTTATPYRNGKFKVKSNFDDIVAYATAFGKDNSRGRSLGTEIKAPSLKRFFLMDYDDFTGDNANFNYGFGLVLTTYFLHLDGEGDAARIKQFLKALRAGDEGQDALDVLMDGRDYAEMEEAITKGWKRKGIDIEFDSPASADED